jgi:outer membrane lipoprotein-sorting protein
MTYAFELAVGVIAAALSPDEILQRADEVRNPAESYALQVRVVSSDMPDEPSEFDVSLLGNTRTLVKTIKPARDRGRNMLMLGEEMWIYLPNLKRAVRVGLSQRLVGQAANGDISRMRWAGDYEAQLDSEDEKEWTLGLTAAKAGLTYDKIRIWIEKGTFRPQRAEYLTRSGKVLKRARFGGYRELCGRERPTEIEIQDAVKPAESSVIEVLRMEVRQFPASLFTPEGLG